MKKLSRKLVLVGLIAGSLAVAGCESKTQGQGGSGTQDLDTTGQSGAAGTGSWGAQDTAPMQEAEQQRMEQEGTGAGAAGMQGDYEEGTGGSGDMQEPLAPETSGSSTGLEDQTNMGEPTDTDTGSDMNMGVEQPATEPTDMNGTGGSGTGGSGAADSDEGMQGPSTGAGTNDPQMMEEPPAEEPMPAEQE